MPTYRRFGNGVINTAHNVFAEGVSDSQCGFRCFNRKVIESVRVTEHGFSFTTEVLSKVRKAGLRIEEIPIRTIYHSELGQNSAMNPIAHGFGVLMHTIRWRWWEITGL